MKLFASKADDRDTICMILCRNGYTVRQGSGRRNPEDKRKSNYVEVVEDGIRETASAGSHKMVTAAGNTGSDAGAGDAVSRQE